MKKRGAIAGSGFFIVIIAASVLFMGDRDGAEETPAPPAGGGMTATIDPETGEFVAGPGPEIPQATGHEGLVEKPSEIPGGGVTVDLEGRFQNSVTAVVDSTDSLHIECGPDSSHAGGR